MSHSHAHGEHGSNYFLDGLCTVAVCAAIGAVAVLMWSNDRLRIILVPAFFKPVLAGGIALLLLAGVRAIALWQLAGRNRTLDAADMETGVNPADDDHGETCNRDHDHGHGHSHGHEHSHSHGNGHDHAHAGAHSNGGDDGHEHAWAPWRYIVLLLPVVLYALNLPNQGFSNERLGHELGADSLEGSGNVRLAGGAVAGATYIAAAKKQTPVTMRFNELSAAALRPGTREHFEGQMIRLKGQYWPLGDKEFQLFRMKRTCCAADAIPLKARIVSPTVVQKLQPRDWVEVVGELTFVKVTGRSEWVSVIYLDSEDQITSAPADQNEYEDL